MVAMGTALTLISNTRQISDMKKYLLLTAALLVSSIGISQTLSPVKGANKQGGGYQFTVEKEAGVGPVKNQAKSNTCWSFSTQSFLESEMMRLGKGQHTLSVMFVVRKAYEMKADKYVRMNGKVAFAEGGEIHDVLTVLRNYGAMPDEAYPGMSYGESNHAHFELEAVLKGYLDGVIQNRNGRLSTAWKRGFSGILDAYLGVLPTEFKYQGKTYTSQSFAQAMGLNSDDYVELTSFSHHPFYKPCMVEVQDNWSGEQALNLPLDEFGHVIENAVMSGYSVAWATDVSEPYFSHKEGVAVVPDRDLRSINDAAKAEIFKGPGPEKVITQEMRQAAFDSQETTDDHGMHIFGAAKDQRGTRYYMVKNSWGTDRNDLGGMFYVSKPYVLYKTTFIAVHKKAIPDAIARKLGLK